MTDPRIPHARFDEARQLFLVAWQDFCRSVPDATRQAEALATQRAMRQIAALAPEPDGEAIKPSQPDVNSPEWHRGFLNGKHGKPNDRDKYHDPQERENYHDGWMTGEAEWP